MLDRPEGAPDAWDAAAYDARHGYVWRHGEALLDLLDPRPGERVLDLGAGTGHLAAEIAARGASVTGVDASPAMVARARARYPALRFELADGADFGFPEPFDAVFSNAALHWMHPPRAVAARIAAALGPGGRLVAELGGRGNIAAVVGALHTVLEEAGLPVPPDPWHFPRLGEYAALLEAAGLEVRRAELFERPTPLEGGEEGLRGWLATFAGSYLDGLPDAERERAVRGVEARLRHACFSDGRWVAPYVRLRVVAVRP